MLNSFDEIGRGNHIRPLSESDRLNYYQTRRDWYNNRFDTLIVPDTKVPINLFRSICKFYPDFMFSVQNEVITENAELQERLDNIKYSFWKALHTANVDMMKVGTGIVITNPYDPDMFMRIDPNGWFQVTNPSNGDILGDICIIWQSKNAIEEYAHIFKLPIEGPGVYELWTSHSGQTLSEKLKEEMVPATGKRRVTQLITNAEHTSILDDAAPHIFELCNTVSRVSGSIKRNLNPHMYGPAAAAPEDQMGRSLIDQDGMYWGINADETPPGYIQWDSQLEAVKWHYDTNYQLALAAVGLNSALFNPEGFGREISGNALRRLNIPFVSKLNRFKEINRQATVEILQRWDYADQYAIDDSNIDVQWNFDQIFVDDLTEATLEADDTQPNESERTESSSNRRRER